MFPEKRMYPEILIYIFLSKKLLELELCRNMVILSIQPNCSLEICYTFQIVGNKYYMHAILWIMQLWKILV